MGRTGEGTSRMKYFSFHLSFGGELLMRQEEGAQLGGGLLGSVLTVPLLQPVQVMADAWVCGPYVPHGQLLFCFQLRSIDPSYSTQTSISPLWFPSSKEIHLFSWEKYEVVV